MLKNPNGYSRVWHREMNMFLGEISLALNRLFRPDNFDEERQKSSDAYKSVAAELSKKPADTDNLTAWAAALMKLNLFATPNESTQILKDAMSKLGRALELDPTHHKALWQLGHTHNALAYLIPNLHVAEMEFDKALECFQKADQLCPGNSDYLRALRSNMANREWYKAKHIRGYKPNFKKATHGYDGGSVTENLPELHKTRSGESAAKHEPDLHKAMYGGLDQVGGGSAASSSAAAITIKCAKKKSEIFGTWSGWETFVSGLVAGMIIMGQGTIKIKGPSTSKCPNSNHCELLC